jgi:hypothetical protein
MYDASDGAGLLDDHLYVIQKRQRWEQLAVSGRIIALIGRREAFTSQRMTICGSRHATAQQHNEKRSEFRSDTRGALYRYY